MPPRILSADKLIVLAGLMMGLCTTASADLITYSETEPVGDPTEGPIGTFTILDGAVEVVHEPITVAGAFSGWNKYFPVLGGEREIYPDHTLNGDQRAYGFIPDPEAFVESSTIRFVIPGTDTAFPVVVPSLYVGNQLNFTDYASDGAIVQGSLGGTVRWEIDLSNIEPLSEPLPDGAELEWTLFETLPSAAIDTITVLGGTSMFDDITVELPGGKQVLFGGDADQDLDFDQLDLVRVQIAAKYLTGQPATWGQGDWNGAPGGSQGSPPVGNGLFDQIDIIAALGPAHYLKGPYAAVRPGGQPGDGQTSVGYNPTTGELFVDAPAATQLTSLNIDSAARIFTGNPAQNLGGSFDNDADNNIFKATFGSSFGSLSFGSVVQVGLSEQFVLADLTIVGSLAGGGALGNVDLIYVPEPGAMTLLVMGAVAMTGGGLVRYRARIRQT